MSCGFPPTLSQKRRKDGAPRTLRARNSREGWARGGRMGTQQPAKGRKRLRFRIGNRFAFLPRLMNRSLASGRTLLSCSGRNEKAALRSHPFRASGFEPYSGCSCRGRAGDHLRRVRDPAVRGHSCVFDPLATSGWLRANRSERRRPSFWYAPRVGPYTHHRHR